MTKFKGPTEEEIAKAIVGSETYAGGKWAAKPAEIQWAKDKLREIGNGKRM